MTACSSWNQRRTRGHRPRLQCTHPHCAVVRYTPSLEARLCPGWLSVTTRPAPKQAYSFAVVAKGRSFCRIYCTTSPEPVLSSLGTPIASRQDSTGLASMGTIKNEQTIDP